ncbi:MAG: 4-hydroxy-3-methylbut-2-enyl diphosphate reductase [Pseudomonadota bacterium]
MRAEQGTNGAKPPLRVLLANPRGFCAGVERAIQTVERALAQHGAPVYVRHEIVHNARVCDTLRKKGAIFIEDLSEVPAGSVVIFSAHGVPRRVEEEAAAAHHAVIDATCPLVSKVHGTARRYVAEGRAVILIGHLGHVEVEGTLGQVDAPLHVVGSVEEVAELDLPPDCAVAYVTQTTLSVTDTQGIIAAIRERFPDTVGPETRDICYATQNRQQAVREIAGDVDLFLVVGARNSSNSNRLVEIAADEGVTAHLVPEVRDFDPNWLQDVASVGITAGASAPEVIVDELLAALSELRVLDVTSRDGVRENITFKLPREIDGRERARRVAV